MGQAGSSGHREDWRPDGRRKTRQNPVEAAEFEFRGVGPAARPGARRRRPVHDFNLSPNSVSTDEGWNLPRQNHGRPRCEFDQAKTPERRGGQNLGSPRSRPPPTPPHCQAYMELAPWRGRRLFPGETQDGLLGFQDRPASGTHGQM
jgi:hypothetical protein